MAHDLDEVFDYNKSWALNEGTKHWGKYDNKTDKFKIFASHYYCMMGRDIFDYGDEKMIEKITKKRGY